MTERFRAYIVVNVLCTVSLMSIFLTVIGTWIGSRGRPCLPRDNLSQGGHERRLTYALCECPQ